MPADLEDYRWLVSDAARVLLDRVMHDLPAAPATPSQIRLLRSSIGATRTNLVLEQVELRRRAISKFARAGELFFTAKGLEQATDDQLAHYKADRFADACDLADLCCGIGGDAMALSCNHATRLVDRDEVSLLLGSANVERLSGSISAKIASDVSPSHVADLSAWHIDPDRRVTGQRTTRPELGDPGEQMIDQLLEACPQGCIKLAPAAGLPKHWISNCEREWIETRGECRQQVVWFGQLAEANGNHVATIVDANGEATSFGAQPDHACDSATKLGKYVFDPSPSLVAARLSGALASGLELQLLSPHSLYFTSEELIVHPHLQAFEVIDQLPLDVRHLRSYCRQCGIGRLEIKKRGVDVTPESLRPRLDLQGDRSATLILCRLQEQNLAVIAQRVRVRD